jgi:hypothetical protein
MRDPTVVGGKVRLNKQQLHAKIMCGWSRAINNVGGKGTFADKLDITVQALDKQLAGSMPTPEVLDQALSIEPTVLDDWMEAHGKRLVDKNAVCDVDDASVLIARLMLWLQEAQHPDSPGGRSVVHTELLPAEFMIRQLHAATGNWIQTITETRRGTEEAA